MIGRLVSLVAVFATLVFTGCGGSPTPPATQAATVETPADTSEIRLTAERFVAGLLSGDARGATKWLTPAAASRVQSEPQLLSAVGASDVAMEVAEVRVVSPAEAIVQCLLTPQGAQQSEELLCVLKRSAGRWGVAGLAWESVGGAEPRVLRFEPDGDTASAGQYVGPAGSNAAPRTAAAAVEAASRR